MEIKDEILINKYGQGLIEIESLLLVFNSFEIMSKRTFLSDIIFLIIQSKPIDSDAIDAILKSGLKSTYTPCVLLKKGVANHCLKKILELPDNELNKSFVLLLNLFKIAYKRRFDLEKNIPHKWWYWDLSDPVNISKIMRDF